ncbi:glycoside hydrolase family 128 protein [Amanita thiersii Skay4041]|uniref:Glycoside hydrolase family 128 protein n=1 Tax=Amanita thiersii Skay4041 TaxID=703135 RepID=A0A2A9NY50_9AGAR|nr:glycoside hydrolase family 128 protein [Amanita thiersii Skay4041]
MAPLNFFNLLALSSLAIIASFSPITVTALSIDSSHHFVRHAPLAHDAIALKKRENHDSKRCRPRPSSSAEAPSSTHAPEPPQTTSTPPPPQQTGSSGGSSGGSGGKVGLAYPSDDISILRSFKTDKVSTVYNWSPYKVPGLDELGFDCASMLWGDKQIDDFQRLVKPGYCKYILGFNEPNQPDQSNMTPQHAADVWRQFIDPKKDQGYTLISPACTNAPSGKQWIHDFLGACQGCRVDAIAVHFYGTSAEELIAYLQDFHATFNKDIWVTEFACQDFSGRTSCSRDDVFKFMATAKGFMDNTPWVKKYFAFGVLGVMHDMYNVNPVNQLLGSNNQPTDLGWLYIN